MKKTSWEIPIKTVSESNCSEHWFKKSQRHRQQQFFVRALFNSEIKNISIPCEIVLTRLSPRYLDDEDNLPIAFKWIKDELGACIFPEKVVNYLSKNGKMKQNKGHADSDPRVKWKYTQEKRKKLGIRIEIIYLNDLQFLDTQNV